jgi:oligopeptide/dipeptide ABC transporter ATP-binding protein
MKANDRSGRRNLLEVQDLVTQFHTRDCTIHAVNGVSFQVREGEVLGIVGESGCGKSVTVKSILRLIPIPPGNIISGSAYFSGEDLISLEKEQLRQIRGNRIGFIFQDPMSSLNPVLTIGEQIMEPMETHLGYSRNKARNKAVELLESIGFPEAQSRLNDYPHQYSGGMRQRVMIAIALSCNPQLLIADEPTTALDVTIQAQIVALLKNIRSNYDMSIIWITHNLGLIAGLVDRVLVMYGGFIVEQAPVAQIFSNPLHPYTQGLLGSLPKLGRREAKRLTNIQGQPPCFTCQPNSCPFAPRCPYAFEKCWKENPALKPGEPAHDVACWWDIERGKPRSDH